MKDCTWKSKKLIAVSILAIILLWQATSMVVNNDIIVPSIKSIILSLLDIIKDKKFLYVIGATILRSLTSFLISIFFAFLIGVLSSQSKILYNFMIPILAFLKSVPTMAIVILALIWLSSEKAPMLIGFIVVFPILYESVIWGIQNVDSKLLDMAKLYKVKTYSIVKNIYIPSILFSINSVINSALGLNLKVVIAGEVLGQPKYSIGSSLQMEKLYLNTSGVFAWIIIVVIFTGVFEVITKLLYKKAYKWK